MTKDCVFCKIAEGKMEARKIHEGEKTIGLIDTKPRWAWGQCVVFPKVHVKQFYQLEKEDFNSLFSTVKKIAKKMEDVFDPNYVSIFTRGQTIEHAHVIIFPAGQDEVIDRYGEMIASFESLKEKTTDQNLDELQERLRMK